MNTSRLLTPLKTIITSPIAQGLVRRNGVAAPIRAFTSTPSNQFSAVESDILQKQRAVRPVSPDLSIYQPQLTWYMSGAHRITGVIVAAAFYTGALSYLAAPAFGYTLDSATIVSTAASLPVAAKLATKTALASPFVFHSLNGIRHLIWDMGYSLNLKGVYTSGYIVLGGTVLGSLYLASL